MLRRLFVTAIKPLILAILLAGWGRAVAGPVGQVSNLSGPLFALNAEGSRRILSIGSHVEAGETLITEDKTYAQVRFLDKGVVTLKPGTQFKIESYAFEEKAPEKDGVVFGLLKGALRTVTGLIGKRGNQDAYRMNTATATIGIRGTQFLAHYVPAEEAVVSRVPYALPMLAALDDMHWIEDDRRVLSDALPVLLNTADMQAIQLAQFGETNGAAGLAPGLYLHVIDGLVNLANQGGSQLFSAGQFAHASSFAVPPVILPVDPGIGSTFVPPPSFLTTQQQAQQAPPGETPSPPASQQRQNQQGEDCVVR